jgi:hypothetical protein
MSNINNLFCTPEQGARLKELVPELTSVMVWISHAREPEKVWIGELVPNPIADFKWFYTAALTLQELFPLLKAPAYTEVLKGFTLRLMNGDLTAPELAEWVIARLEDQG